MRPVCARVMFVRGRWQRAQQARREACSRPLLAPAAGCPPRECQRILFAPSVPQTSPERAALAGVGAGTNGNGNGAAAPSWWSEKNPYR